MAANNFILPLASTAIGTARIFYNDNHEALLTNFYGSTIPTSANFVKGGAFVSPETTFAGLLWRDTTTQAIWISDPNVDSNFPLGGKFTRTGLGNRIEDTIANLVSKISTYEYGDIGVVKLAANARAYVRTTGGLVDIGIPAALTVTGAMVVNNTLDGSKMGANVAVTDRITSFSVTGQQSTATAAVIIRNTTGNAHIGFNSNGANATIKYAGSNAQFAVTGNDGTTQVPITASKIQENNANLVPAGTVVMFAATSPPTGWMLCDGTSLLVADYSALYDAIGYAFGGAGANFNIPDLRDRFVLGSGSNNSVGGATGRAAAGASTTLSGSTGAGGSHTPGVTTTSVAATAKDSTTTSVVTAVSAVGDHTHTLSGASIVTPMVVLAYIIKVT